jgi:hypothetical protein
MQPACFRLCVFQNGRAAAEPFDLNEVTLREALLIASNFNEDRVNFICKTVEEHGRCEMLDTPGKPRFVIEKIFRS